MAENYDRPDDSKAPRHQPGSVAEETSATGQRIKGAAKDVVGDLLDDEEMEEKGERENQAGIERQKSGVSPCPGGGRGWGRRGVARSASWGRRAARGRP
jgi:uncharacterized protein YjbJ (UPF0337 family)